MIALINKKRKGIEFFAKHVTTLCSIVGKGEERIVGKSTKMFFGFCILTFSYQLPGLAVDFVLLHNIYSSFSLLVSQYNLIQEFFN